jgi:transcriptional regulator with XRE-family HTH domain
MNESELRGILGTNLKKYRNYRKLSQAELAEMVDISPNFISDLETGKRWLSSDTLAYLANVLSIEVRDFFTVEKAVSDEFAEFIAEYTEKAVREASYAVAMSLKNLQECCKHGETAKTGKRGTD